MQIWQRENNQTDLAEVPSSEPVLGLVCLASCKQVIILRTLVCQQHLPLITSGFCILVILQQAAKKIGIRNIKHWGKKTIEKLLIL